ncbi:Thioesterase domain-containing protein [Chitinophaga rupis]|uniref:Thioesterase domain-containing protein n=2 Tax=Chitinophaga rupis TaxID=573321 RepID=A0A1H8ECE8_9BACT|nr:Thioesterase domain-containing protein [Chitinophaga rupis]
MGNKHLVMLSQDKELPPVFIIPGAGGLSNDYYELALELQNNYCVYCPEMYGTVPGEVPLETISDIAALNIKWMKEVQPEGPYRLIGHSFGAYPAFEMARQLEQKGDEVAFTAILDEYATLHCLIDENAQINALKLAADYLRDFDIIRHPFPEWFVGLADELYDLPLKQLAGKIAELLKEHLPEKSEDIDFTTSLINLRIYNAHMSYHPDVKLQGELIIFRSAQNEEHEAGAMGWAPYGESVNTIELQDGHGMRGNENARIIAGQILLKDISITPSTPGLNG